MPGLFALALVVRLPTLGLPLEGASAVLASVADQLSRGQGWELVGQAPLLPLLASLLVSSGLPATLALRWTDAVLAAALAPLLFVLLGRLGVRLKTRTVAGVLMAVHPLGLFGPGGMQPGSGTLAGALVLAALICLLSARPWARRVGACLTLALCTADPGALLVVPGLLWLYSRAETGARTQTTFVLIGGLLLLGGPLLWFDLPQAPSAKLGAACLWLLVAGLAFLLPPLPRGLGQLWSRGAAAQAWLLGGGLALLSAVLGGPVFALGLLPLVIAGGVIGAHAFYARAGQRLGPARTRAVAAGSFVGVLLLSVWISHGGLRPKEIAAGAGRLHLLRDALVVAADEAGSEGWIVLAVAEDRPAEQASLADLAPDHWTWARRAPSGAGASDVLRRLLVFPAATLEPGRTVAVVAEAGQTGAIETFGGAGIYEQELIRQIGPYVVLRATRP